jgi:hypothetical protein
MRDPAYRRAERYTNRPFASGDSKITSGSVWQSTAENQSETIAAGQADDGDAKARRVDQRCR